MLETIIGILIFTFIIIFLIILILISKTYLSPNQNINIDINQKRKSINSKAGEKLLNILNNNEVFIPSACGGNGTCGQCRIKILKGGSEGLPIEKAILTQKELRNYERLACQVNVKNDLEIEIPSEIFDVKKITCKVRSNKNIASYIKELILELPNEEDLNFRAGGYIQVEAPSHQIFYSNFNIEEKYKKAWEAFLGYKSIVNTSVSRAYSIANYPDEKGIIILNIRIALPPQNSFNIPPGKLSSFIFNLKSGDEIVVSGPYGEFFAKETNKEMIFIGGGVGMAPMRSHIFDQLKRLNTQRKISFWYGAKSKQDIIYKEEFDQLEKDYSNFNWQLALSEPLSEDHWNGFRGFIHDVLYQHYLKEHPAPEDCEYYLCGPPLMVEAILRMLDDLGVEPENIMFDNFG